MWSYSSRLGKRVFVPVGDATVVSRPATTLLTSTQHTYTSDFLFEPGLWVQSTGTASINNGSVTSWTHDLDASHAYPHLTLATTHPCGVCQDSDGHIIHSGLAMAWVIKPKQRRLDLDGMYAMYVNGVQVHNVVILRASPTSRSFVICATKDDQQLQLKRRLDALTTE